MLLFYFVSLVPVSYKHSSEISHDGPQYYDQELQMLKFPVLVHPLGPLYGDSPPLVLEVFALLTCPSDIVLTPGSLDFGRVTTLETVTASVRLTNCSLAAQYYGFLRLPKGVSVQPGHGFGYVLPQNTVPLVVLYSPCPMDIQGNVTGQNGVNGPHTFTLRCATVAASLTTPHRGVHNTAPMSGKSVTPPTETPAGTVASVSVLQEDAVLGDSGSLDNIEEETVLNVKDLDVISTDLEVEVLSERDVRPVPLTTGLLRGEHCSADNVKHEMYELHGARTILPLMMSGSGVTPDYQFTPDFLLYRFEGRTGRTVDLTLEIKNTCSAPLPFQIREVFTRAALDKPPTPPPTPEPQAKGKPKKEKKPPKMSSVLSPEDERAFEKHFRDIKKEGALIFSVATGTSDSVSEAVLVVPPGEKVALKVRFTPPVERVSFIRGKMSGETEELPQRDEGRGEARGKKQTTERGHLDPDVNKSRKKRKQSLLTGKKGAAQYQAAEIVYPLKYAVKYKVSLGNIIDVRELIFIGRVLPDK